MVSTGRGDLFFLHYLDVLLPDGGDPFTQSECPLVAGLPNIGIACQPGECGACRDPANEVIE
jgi:hypothetical protein